MPGVGAPEAVQADREGRYLPVDARGPVGAPGRSMTDLGGGVYRDRHGCVYRVGPRRVHVYHGSVGPHSSGSISRALWETRLRSGGVPDATWEYPELVHECAPMVGEGASGRREVTSLDTVRKILRGQASGSGWRAAQARADWLRRGQLERALLRRESEHQVAGRELPADRCRRAASRLAACGVLRGVRSCGSGCGHQGEPERFACGQWQLCPYCARVHSRRRQAELLRVVRRYRQGAGCRWRLVTLPVRTSGDLAEATKVIAGSVGRLWAEYLAWRWAPVVDPERLRHRRGRSYLGRRRAEQARDGRWWVRDGRADAGAFRAIEFGDVSGNGHAHLLASMAWFPQSLLSAVWERMTGGSYVVHLTLVGGRKREGGGCTLAGAVAEVAKYVAKVGTMRTELAVSAWEALAGRQVTQVYGALRGVVIADAALGAWTCPKCGGHVQVWSGVSYEVAWQEHERGPPSEHLVGGAYESWFAIEQEDGKCNLSA